MKICHLALPFIILLLPIIASAQNVNDDLIAAAKRGDVEAVRALIAKGANVNTRTTYGATALHFAADRGHLEVVKALVEAGADVNAKDDFYKITPATMAMMHKQREVADYLQRVVTSRKDAAQAVNAQSAPSQAQAKAGNPALSEELLNAAKKGDLPAVRSLLARGADVNAKTRYGQTPLMLAADKGAVEVVKALLGAGADVNVTDTFYKSVTALSAAAQRGHAEIVKLLIEKGASGRENALFAAIGGGHSSIVKTVLDAGGIKQESLNQALGFALERERSEIAELLRKSGAAPPPPKTLKPEVKVDEATLQRYAGTYRLDETRQYTFIVKDGRLGGWDVRQYSLSLTPIEKNVFRIGSSDDRTITFNEENGKIISITVTQSGFKQTYNRVEGK
jgi:ankyrin repeat protein